MPEKILGFTNKDKSSGPTNPKIQTETKEKPSKKDIGKEIPENPNKVSNDSKNETPKGPKEPIPAEYQKNLVNKEMQSAPINPTIKSDIIERSSTKDIDFKIPDIVKKVPITTENHKKINSKQTTRLNNIKLSPDVSSNDISEDSETSTPEDTFDHNVRHKKDKSNLDIKDEPITDKNANKKSETPMKNAGILSINMLSEPFIPTVKSEIKEKPSKTDIVKEIPENPNKVSNDSKNETPKIPKKPIAANYQKNIVNKEIQSAPINPTNKSETKENPSRKDQGIEIPEMAKISSIDGKKESPNIPKEHIAADYQKNIVNKLMQSAPINPTNKSKTKEKPSTKGKGIEIPEMAKISSIDSKKESPKGPKEPNAAENQKLVVSKQTTKPNKHKLSPKYVANPDEINEIEIFPSDCLPENNEVIQKTKPVTTVNQKMNQDKSSLSICNIPKHLVSGVGKSSIVDYLHYPSTLNSGIFPDENFPNNNLSKFHYDTCDKIKTAPIIEPSLFSSNSENPNDNAKSNKINKSDDNKTSSNLYTSYDVASKDMIPVLSECITTNDKKSYGHLHPKFKTKNEDNLINNLWDPTTSSTNDNTVKEEKFNNSNIILRRNTRTTNNLNSTILSNNENDNNNDIITKNQNENIKESQLNTNIKSGLTHDYIEKIANQLLDKVDDIDKKISKLDNKKIFGNELNNNIIESKKSDDLNDVEELLAPGNSIKHNNLQPYMKLNKPLEKIRNRSDDNRTHKNEINKLPKAVKSKQNKCRTMKTTRNINKGKHNKAILNNHNKKTKKKSYNEKESFRSTKNEDYSTSSNEHTNENKNTNYEMHSDTVYKNHNLVKNYNSDSNKSDVYEYVTLYPEYTYAKPLSGFL
ncbi:Hypothetical protein CINCED_3A024162 [Cinara cedri]|uniref:Uncharacterized protein n=1 Tax=Cinara cedri TaxID=506608 RepID=A0A5E4M0P3_9HEMI|nr:Hypothetical protein CINCED_3A024162 [Cinara cedri]